MKLRLVSRYMGTQAPRALVLEQLVETPDMGMVWTEIPIVFENDVKCPVDFNTNPTIYAFSPSKVFGGM